jgi:hypothetical protein
VQVAITKAQLIAELRSSGHQVADSLRQVPPANFERGRYENGWNGRQILAHIASVEWTYPRLIQLARDAKSAPAPATSSAAAAHESANTSAPGQSHSVIDDYNARQVAKRADTSITDLVQEFVRNREATIAAVEGIDETMLLAPVNSVGGVSGLLGEVLHNLGVDHLRSHTADITGEPWQGTRY